MHKISYDLGGTSYSLGVIVIQNVFGELGRGSPIAIVFMTLGTTVVFILLRGRIQAIIDRLFYRRKYDLTRTLSYFSGLLRDELEVDALSEAILDMIEETLQPEYATIWLNSPENPQSKRAIR